MPLLTFMTNSRAEWMLGYLGIENLFAKIESSEPYLPPQLFPLEGKLRSQDKIDFV